MYNIYSKNLEYDFRKYLQLLKIFELKTLEEYSRRKISNCIEHLHGKYSFFLRAHILTARNSWEIKEHLDHERGPWKESVGRA